MKLASFLYIAILLLPLIGRIAEINRLKSEAKAAYNAGNYTTAIQKYTYLVDSLQIEEEEVLLNLANACFQARDTAHAEQYYRRLQQEALIPGIRSRSNQQLGVLANRKGDLGKALTYFKNALKADPTNDGARYNYELLIRKMSKKNQDPKDQDKQNQKDQKDRQDQDKQNQKDQKDRQGQDKQNQKDQKDRQGQDKQNQKDQKDRQGQDKQNQKDQKDRQGQDKQNQKDQKDRQGQDKQQNKGQQNPKDQKPQDRQGDKGKDNQRDQQQPSQRTRPQDKKIPSSVAEKLKQLNMSEETAKMILEAMKNSEIQYLQQKKRNATKSKDTSKPDW